jgi:hypothetical protein
LWTSRGGYSPDATPRVAIQRWCFDQVNEHVAGIRFPLKGPDLRRVAKVFSGGEYQDGSVLANEAGLQVARIATQYAAFRARKPKLDADIRPHVEAFERDGVLVLENFFHPEVFATIQEECRAAYADGIFDSSCVEDNSVLEERASVKKHKQLFPVTWAELNRNELLTRLATAIIRRPAIPKLNVTVDYMTKTPDAPAPERLAGTNYLHADVHYPSSKAWLYLHDIDEENGAFVYAKGSHKLGLARIAYERDASIRTAGAKRAANGQRTSNVLRMPTARQLRAMGIVETPICGKANSLVFADR